MSIRPIVATLSATLFLALLATIPGLLGFLLVLCAILVVPLLLLTALCLIGWSLFRRRWYRALSLALATGLPVLLWRPIAWLADCLHLLLTIGFGIGQIGPAFISSDRRFSAHNWSIGLVTNPSTFLIYDATDRVARPGARRYGFECTAGVVRVVGHYYRCNF